MKVRVNKPVKEFSVNDMPGTVSGLIEFLQEIEKEHGTELSLDTYYYDGGCDITAYKYREETDEEYDVRITKEAYWKKNLEKSELEQLKRLKEKYEQ